MQGRLPEFLGIGVQKGGTTTLQRLLEQHPQVYLPPRKELHYFSLHYGKGEAWYRQQFADARADQRCGEITPYYLFHPEAPQRIKALLPDVTLLVLLRDPVERALSQVFHSQRLGLEPLPLEQALAAESERLAGADDVLAAVDGRHRSHQEHSYLARSRYELQLQRFEACFGADQIVLRRSEDLFERPEQVWLDLLHHLGLQQIPLPETGRRAHVGSRGGDDLDEERMAELRDKLAMQLQPTYQYFEQHHGLSWPRTGQ